MVRLAARLAALAALTAPITARAQWTVTNLHPLGATQSSCLGAGGGQQAGKAFVSGFGHAGLWNRGATTWTDLNPAGATESVAWASDGVQQVGSARIAGTTRASLWSGTATSWVDLQPVGARFSVVRGIGGGQQAGEATFNDNLSHAGMWTGTASSWVDLHPPTTTASYAYAVSSGQQVGSAVVIPGNIDHASVWSGTAGSWVDLHPGGAGRSFCLAADGGQQAGVVDFGLVRHAALWSGTASSWIDLHPAGATSSIVYAASGGRQVGYVTFDAMQGVTHAALWSGSAGSLLDLHAFLPPGFSSSLAQGISSDGTYLYVAGNGNNGGTALLWTRPLCDVAPSIFIPPQPITTCASGTAAFNVVAFSLGTPTYQWQWRPQGSAAWLDIVSGVNTNPGTGQPAFDASGPTSVSVTMTNSVGTSTAVSGGRREIQVVVSNPCGSETSSAAIWTICPPDFNCSGTITVNDIFAFLSAWFAGTPAADFNGTGGISVQDIFDFLSAWFAGC